MSYTAVVENYIDELDVNQPILIDEIKKLVGENAKMILTRFVKLGKLIRRGRGVYCKPKETIWGVSLLGNDQVITKKYIADNEIIFGYITGAKLFNRLGLTTQLPRYTEIVTNACKGKNKVTTEYGAIVKKPKLEVNAENYLYQQIIDIFENKSKIQIEAENPNQLIYDFYDKNNLDFAQLYRIALLRKASQRVLDGINNTLLLRSWL